MKRIAAILSAMLLGCISSFAQNPSQLEGIGEFTFFGVDFSHVQVFAAEETPSEFVKAFEGINNLFLTEPDKYVALLERRLQRPVSCVDIRPAVEQLQKIDLENLKTLRTVSNFTGEEMSQMVRDLPIEEDLSGTGLVILANCLDKSRPAGHFVFVFFDIDTRDIITAWNSYGEARGFGLRNYWARSVYKAISYIRTPDYRW